MEGDSVGADVNALDDTTHLLHLIYLILIWPDTMEPMAGNNYQSHQEKKLTPGFPGSRQGKDKSG